MIAGIPFLAGAGLLAGAMNSIAGGGSFVTLPALLAAGLSPVAANASSTVALFPGSLTAAWTLRGGIKAFETVSFRTMALITVVGGFAGAGVLLTTPEVTFNNLLPWLLLFATCAFTFARQGGALLARIVTIGPRSLLVCQFILGFYGGYFGGAVGITMLAVWSLFGGRDLRSMNASRVVMTTLANGAAVLCFVGFNRVIWPQSLVILVMALIGAYAGAMLARTIDPKYLRGAIIGLCAVMTVGFFVRAYG